MVNRRYASLKEVNAFKERVNSCCCVSKVYINFAGKVHLHGLFCVPQYMMNYHAVNSQQKIIKAQKPVISHTTSNSRFL